MNDSKENKVYCYAKHDDKKLHIESISINFTFAKDSTLSKSELLKMAEEKLNKYSFIKD